MDLSPEHLRIVVVNMIVLILSIAVHEFGHALVADRLGDRLPRHEGRVTLNPIVHADPIGTLALPLFSMLSGGFIGFGWGRPVRINPAAFTRRFSMRTGHMLVAAAGPAMNVLFGFLLSFVLLILWKTGTSNVLLINAVINAIALNFVLAVFNLVPAPPLDGGAVLAGLLPTRYQRGYERYSAYGIFVLIAVIVIPPINHAVTWPARQFTRLWLEGVLGIPLA
jgi:Zn-dependent protease